MQRRVEQPDRHRAAVHRLEQAVEIALLQRQQLVERRTARLVVVDLHDHPAHLRLPVGGHEHVLGAAEADALGAEAPARAGRPRACRRSCARRACAARRPSSRIWAKRSSTSGWISGTSSVVTAPVEPSIAMRSPARSVRPATWTSCMCRSMSRSAAPVTAGRPIPRATSAACEALPPSEVRMPAAAAKPGDVLGLGERPDEDHPLALVRRGDRALGREDDVALGGARRGGDAARDDLVLGRRVERRVQQGVEPVGVDRRDRLGLARAAPRSTASTAKCTAACAGRLALRVCSMYRRPSSIVNSVSCMSP